MGHDPTKVLMGTTKSNVKDVDNFQGTLDAGILAHLKSDGTVTALKSDGAAIGVSIGKDLSNIGRTAVARAGLGIPVKLKAGFNPTVGLVALFDDTTGLATGDGTNTAYSAVYASGRIGGSGVNGGLAEDGTTVGVALVDFPGGL